MKTRKLAACLLSLGMCLEARADFMPADRRTTWHPGVTYNGGIPNRTTIYKTINPSGGDDTNAIQNALDSCPSDKVVQLGAGTFNISGDGIWFKTSRVTLRGTLGGGGALLSRLVKTDNTNFGLISMGHDIKWSMSDHYTLASNGAKGATSVTLASTPSPALTVGEIVVINIQSNALTRWNPTKSPPGDESRGYFQEYERPIGQTLEVASVSGGQVTFTTPLHIDFNTVDQARLVRFKIDSNATLYPSPTQWSGIESLYVGGGHGGDNGGNIGFSGVKYCWVKNIESDKSDGGSIHLHTTFRCDIRDSYFHSTVNATPGGAGYGIGINTYASDNLVEDNISWNFNKVMVMRVSGGGNVVGYNYMQDGWIEYQPDMIEAGFNASHMTTPHFELFEGNESFAFSGDATWGGSVYITAFRNHMTLTRTALPPMQGYSYSTTPPADPHTFYYEDNDNRNAVGLGFGHWYYSVIGNVLGSPDMKLLTNPKSDFGKPQSAFVLEEDGNLGHVPMWDLDGIDNDSRDSGKPQSEWMDPQVKATIFRHGNYDYVTHSQTWDPSYDHALPDSLYLSGKPSFFGGNAWPWVDPATGTTYTLPAKACFNSADSAATMGCLFALGGGVPPPPDTMPPAKPKNLRMR